MPKERQLVSGSAHCCWSCSSGMTGCIRPRSGLYNCVPSLKEGLAVFLVRRVAVLGLSQFCVSIAGCVPVVAGHYLSVDAPKAQYFKHTCGGTVGPPSIAYFPYHGIYVSAWLPALMLGLHLPANSEAKLDSNELRITAITPSGPIEETYPLVLQSFEKALGLNPPPELRRQTDGQKYGNVINGTVKGAVAGQGILWYLFRAGDRKQPPDQYGVSLPAKSSGGDFEVPAMTINGVHYPAQPLPITRKTYSELMPVNC